MFSAKDIYFNGEGNLKVKLLSLIKVVDAKGKEIDENSARVILKDGDVTVEGISHFNQQGQITQFKAKRFKDGVMENWSGFYHDYREVEGMKVPIHVEVVWNLETGDFKYVDFTVKKLSMMFH